MPGATMSPWASYRSPGIGAYSMRWLALPLVAASLVGCGRKAGAPERAPEAVTIAVSIPPQAYLVERIGGSSVRVITLLRPGQTPETYQPTDAQVGKLAKAAVYFRLGVPFERGKWLRMVRAAGTGLRVVDMHEGVSFRSMRTGSRHTSHSPQASGAGTRDSHRESPDPHIWLSPRRLKIQARTVARTLIQVNPHRRTHYEANLRGLLADLDRLDEEFRTLTDPLRGRRFYVYHPAWGYFADDYGLEQVALEAEGKPHGDRALTGLLRQARRDGVQVVFASPQAPVRAVQTLARALGARVETLDPLAGDLPANLRRTARRIAEACVPVQ